MLTIELATLGAAAIAAVASLVTLIVSVFADRASESRSAHREALAPHLAELSEAIYATVATSSILTEAKSDAALENWRGRAEEAKNKLKATRLQLRYPLWGITDPMSTLARLPDWIEHARPLDAEHSARLFKSGRSLANTLDQAIRRSYSRGKPPSRLDRFKVWFHETRLVKSYGKMKADR